MMMIIIIIIIIITKLQELLRLNQTFSRDIKMVFGIEKCKTLCIAKGKLEMRNFTTETMTLWKP